MEYKYLGVIMDNKLSWKSQVAYVVSKAGKRIGLLGRIRKQLTQRIQQARYIHRLSGRYLTTVIVPGLVVIERTIILWNAFRDELQ